MPLLTFAQFNEASDACKSGIKYPNTVTYDKTLEFKESDELSFIVTGKGKVGLVGKPCTDTTNDKTKGKCTYWGKCTADEKCSGCEWMCGTAKRKTGCTVHDYVKWEESLNPKLPEAEPASKAPPLPDVKQAPLPNQTWYEDAWSGWENAVGRVKEGANSFAEYWNPQDSDDLRPDGAPKNTADKQSTDVENLDGRTQPFVGGGFGSTKLTTTNAEESAGYKVEKTGFQGPTITEDQPSVTWPRSVIERGIEQVYEWAGIGGAPDEAVNPPDELLTGNHKEEQAQSIIACPPFTYCSDEDADAAAATEKRESFSTWPRTVITETLPEVEDWSNEQLERGQKIAADAEKAEQDRLDAGRAEQEGWEALRRMEESKAIEDQTVREETEKEEQKIAANKIADERERREQEEIWEASQELRLANMRVIEEERQKLEAEEKAKEKRVEDDQKMLEKESSLTSRAYCDLFAEDYHACLRERNPWLIDQSKTTDIPKNVLPSEKQIPEQEKTWSEKFEALKEFPQKDLTERFAKAEVELRKIADKQFQDALADPKADTAKVYEGRAQYMFKQYEDALTASSLKYWAGYWVSQDPDRDFRDFAGLMDNWRTEGEARYALDGNAGMLDAQARFARSTGMCEGYDVSAWCVTPTVRPLGGAAAWQRIADEYARVNGLTN